jgi:hypothetical protein
MKGPILEETSQNLLTSKKQGNLDLVHASNIIISQRKLALTARNTIFALLNHWIILKIVKLDAFPISALS